MLIEYPLSKLGYGIYIIGDFPPLIVKNASYI